MTIPDIDSQVFGLFVGCLHTGQFPEDEITPMLLIDVLILGDRFMLPQVEAQALQEVARSIGKGLSDELLELILWAYRDEGALFPSVQPRLIQEICSQELSKLEVWLAALPRDAIKNIETKLDAKCEEEMGKDVRDKFENQLLYIDAVRDDFTSIGLPEEVIEKEMKLHMIDLLRLGKYWNFQDLLKWDKARLARQRADRDASAKVANYGILVGNGA
jgi:hypothetical protein